MKKSNKEKFVYQMTKSIKSFDYYKTVVNQNISKSLSYFIKLIILYSIIITICVINSMHNSINEVKNIIDTEIFSLTYSQGILTVNNDEEMSILNNYIIIDTSKEDISEYENIATIAFGKDYCTVNVEDNIFKITYNDYFYEDINKDDIINFLSNIGIKYYILIALLILVWMVIILAISTFMDILVIALIGFITTKIINKKTQTFTNMINIAIHAITLPIILGAIYYIINTITGFYIEYFSIMYTSIAIIYMMTAILLIAMDKIENDKTDF